MNLEIEKVEQKLTWNVFDTDGWIGCFWHGNGVFWWVAEKGVVGRKFPNGIVDTNSMAEFISQQKLENESNGN